MSCSRVRWVMSPLTWSVWQQLLKLLLVQSVGFDDMVKLLHVPPQVLHEMGDAGLLQDPKFLQMIHIFIGDLMERTWALHALVENNPREILHTLSPQGILFHSQPLTSSLMPLFVTYNFSTSTAGKQSKTKRGVGT